LDARLGAKIDRIKKAIGRMLLWWETAVLIPFGV
jgi:hypothetical protein